jgi:exopolysaccharide biosynthesis polyprenyl glycosylphosphotransferase
MFISSRKAIFDEKFLFLGIDLFSLLLSVYLAALVRFNFVGANDYLATKLLPLSINVLIYLTLFYLSGLYELKRFRSYLQLFMPLLFSVISGVLLSSFLFYATFSFDIGRGIFFIKSVFILIFISLPRLAYFFIAKKRILDKRLIILGTGDAALDAITLIERNPNALYRVTGIINEEEESKALSIGGHKILGNVEDIERVIGKFKVDAIVVTTLEPKRHRILKNLRASRYHGIDIIDVVSLYEEIENRVPLKYIDDEWLFSSNISYQGFHARKLKRLIDIVGSALGLILSLPIYLIVPILIKVSSAGPVFYRQKRLGRYGKPFRVLKFRTMIHHAERHSGGPVWSQENDPRITAIGRWLRKARIDETPQLINVFLGHMSMVGPRPERPVFIKELSQRIPFYYERLYVQPGLTGWAQINYPYAGTIEEAKIKLQYDLYYIKHISFFLDCLILFKTIKIVLFGRGR